MFVRQLHYDCQVLSATHIILRRIYYSVNVMHLLNLTCLQSASPKNKGLPPLPTQILPHQLQNASLNDAVLFFPQPLSHPGYPVVLYL